eukprot:scaffold79445_cov48-Cyclotella_meneghiniana.AAC.5
MARARSHSMRAVSWPTNCPLQARYAVRPLWLWARPPFRGMKWISPEVPSKARCASAKTMASSRLKVCVLSLALSPVSYLARQAASLVRTDALHSGSTIGARARHQLSVLSKSKNFGFKRTFCVLRKETLSRRTSSHQGWTNRVGRMT